jgi:hypothetical protein
VHTLWAYAYRVAPAPPGAVGVLRRVVEAENAAALEQARSWAAQLIIEQRSTQILVVTDTPAQNRAVNRRLETTLRRLDGSYRVTPPVPLAPARAN